MAEISIIMVATCDVEDHIAESIESVLNQSFPDFELVVVICDSSDSIRSVISSYKDRRIRLIESKTDYVESLNLGLNSSKGKYVVHMHADDLMHIDRLKINYSTMEESSEITVCGNWVYMFGEKMNKRILNETVAGLIERPLLRMILDDTIFDRSPMIRNSFITKHELSYQNYVYAEDFKLSADIANLGGTFYMETQPLLYKRMDDTKILRKHRLQKLNTLFKIKKGMLDMFCIKNQEYPALVSLCNSYYELAKQGLITHNEIFQVISTLIVQNMAKFKI